MTSRAPTWSSLSLIAALSATLTAQCETRWQNTVGVSGVNGSVHDTVMWDPDGSGPRTPVWVVVGNFTAAGTITANHVATYDPASGQWGTLDTGLDREALALAVLPNNDLVVGGRFRSAGGVPVERVARWNGSGWSAVGAGLPNRIEVTELAMDASGGLLAAAGVIGWPTSTSEVMRWDGTSWSPTGMTCAGVIHALEPLATGEVIVGGSFATSGTTPTGGIARWDGTTWHDYGSGVGPVFGTQGSVRALAIAANGDLVIGGFFVGVSGAGAINLARWNGNSWTAFAGPGTGTVSMLRTMPTGDLIVGASSVSSGGIAHSGIARYDGTNWHSIGSDTAGSATSLAIAPNGDWLVSGLSTAGGIAAGNVARWNGTSWQTIGNGLSGAVDALTTMSNGDLVVTGNFRTAGSVTANRIARWNGGTWSALGNGFDGRAYAVTTLPNGDIIAGGDFNHSGGQAISALARWNGSSWSALGSGLAIAPFPPIVLALATHSNGDLIVAGAFASAGGTSGPSVARWDGSNWHQMGNEATASGVYALASSTTDELFASGAFLINGLQHNGVAHWNGSAWTAVGGEFDFPPEALAVSPSGEIWAGGRFDQAEGNPVESLARWNGTGWVQVGSGIALNAGETVDAITFLPNGDALVLGDFLHAGGQRVDHVARWDGSNWSAVDSGLDAPAGTLTQLSDGSLAVGGSFDRAGSVVSSRLTALSSDCPATVTAGTGGCTGSAGPNTLTALGLPWTGTTLRSRADGLTTNALALGVFGLSTTNVPLSALTPLSLPGCTSTVTPDITGFYVPTNGMLTLEVAIPDVPALAGVIGYQQVVAAELDSQGVITAVTSTNRIAATIGVF